MGTCFQAVPPFVRGHGRGHPAGTVGDELPGSRDNHLEASRGSEA